MAKIKLQINQFSRFKKNGKALISYGPGNSTLAYFPDTKTYVLQKGRCASGRCQQETIYRGRNKALVNKFIREIAHHYKNNT